MTRGLFEYPQQAAFGRVLPKSKIYAFSKVSRRLRDLFAAEIHQIIWRFKLAPETVNLPAGPGVAEIQVFGVQLKPGVDDIIEDLLLCIDKAIAFPIIFEVTAVDRTGERIKVVAAYKRPSESDSSKWVVGDYFSTDWLAVATMRSPLPVALNLAALYEQMLRQLIPLDARQGEALAVLVERHGNMRAKQQELEKLKAQMAREKQFNRKVELNARLRAAKVETDELAN